MALSSGAPKSRDAGDFYRECAQRKLCTFPAADHLRPQLTHGKYLAGARRMILRAQPKVRSKYGIPCKSWSGSDSFLDLRAQLGEVQGWGLLAAVTRLPAVIMQENPALQWYINYCSTSHWQFRKDISVIPSSVWRWDHAGSCTRSKCSKRLHFVHYERPQRYAARAAACRCRNAAPVTTSSSHSCAKARIFGAQLLLEVVTAAVLRLPGKDLSTCAQIVRLRYWWQCGAARLSLGMLVTSAGSLHSLRAMYCT